MPRASAAGSPRSTASRSARYFWSGSDDVAKLRLLLVDPAGAAGWASGWSRNASRFARQCGYRKITLWTQSILVAARKIYQDAGFTLVATEPHRSFGQNLIGETWELSCDLSSGQAKRTPDACERNARHLASRYALRMTS